MAHALLILSVLAAPLASALRFPSPGAAPTLAAALEEGFNPKPTSAPAGPWSRFAVDSPEHIFGLDKRQSGGPVCGYANGNSSLPVGCGTSSQCATDSVDFVAGCCAYDTPLDECYLPTLCLDYTSFTQVNKTTVPDARTAHCESDFPYCMSLESLVEPGTTYFSFACNIRQRITETYFVPTGAFAPTTTAVSSSSSGSPVSNPSTSAVVTSGIAEASATPSSPGGGDNSGTDSADNADDNHHSSSVVGPVVGGVVGGLAGLALIAGALWFFMRRRKRTQAATGTGVNPAYVPVATGGPGGPGSPTNAYNQQPMSEMGGDSSYYQSASGGQPQSQYQPTNASSSPPVSNANLSGSGATPYNPTVYHEVHGDSTVYEAPGSTK